MVFTPGDPGPLPVTKVGGVPWWPQGVARPHCPDGHAMSFLLQMRLADIPALAAEDHALLTFHYCQECMYAGHGAAPTHICGAWQWDEEGYDLRVFARCAAQPVDGVGILAEDVLSPHVVSFIDRMETPSMKDIYQIPEVASLLPEDWYFEEDVFECIASDAGIDVQAYPHFMHVPNSKLGGWPSWCQYEEWPEDDAGHRLIFAGQIDWVLGERSRWGGGGYAYLFLNTPEASRRLARLVIQTT